jgi:hypothetical protein
VTVPELLQLYTPLAGMLALAFWVGVLSERVKSLRHDVQELKNEHTEGEAPAIIRLKVEMEGVKTAVEKLGRGMEGVQRQLGNLMQKGHSIQDLNP